MAMDAVPFDLLRSSLDSLKLRFQAANGPGLPRKAWLTQFRDKGDGRPPILGVRLDGYQDYGYLRLKPITDDAVRLLDSLPASVQIRLWGRPTPEIPVQSMSDSDRIPQWVMAVFELLNKSGVGPRLRRVRDLPLDEQPVSFKFGGNAELCATLPDFVAASVEAIDILQSWLGDVPKQETKEAGQGGKGSDEKRKGGKTVSTTKRGRKPATDDQIKEACAVRIEYQQKRIGKKDFCDWRNGDKKVGRVGVKWLNAKLALVQKLLRESPERIPKRFANKLKPLRRVKRAV